VSICVTWRWSWPSGRDSPGRLCRCCWEAFGSESSGPRVGVGESARRRWWGWRWRSAGWRSARARRVVTRLTGLRVLPAPWVVAAAALHRAGPWSWCASGRDGAARRAGACPMRAEPAGNAPATDRSRSGVLPTVCDRGRGGPHGDRRRGRVLPTRAGGARQARDWDRALLKHTALSRNAERELFTPPRRHRCRRRPLRLRLGDPRQPARPGRRAQRQQRLVLRRDRAAPTPAGTGLLGQQPRLPGRPLEP